MNKLVIISSIISTVAINTATAEPSKCRGLEEKACLELVVVAPHKACIWVKGYQTVAGSTRKPYCRASNKRLIEANGSK